MQNVTINIDSFKTNKKIKLNNFYLDDTKHIPLYTTSISQIPSSTNVSNPDKFKGVVHQNKNVSASKSSANFSKKSTLQTPSHLNVKTLLSNISNDISNNSFQLPLPNIRLDSNNKFKGVLHRHKNVFAYKSSANMSIQSTLQTPHLSHLNVRTPLSNISNAMDISNNSFQSPLPNIRQYSIFSNGVTSSKSSTITSRSSSVMLTNPNHKNKRKNENLPPIPIIGLRFDEDKNDGENNQNIYNSISKDCYMLNMFCKIKKMNLSDAKEKNINYSLCCAYGKVELSELKNAPPSYENLYRFGDSKCKHFMKNIRCYKSMFSFMSMSGKIDSSINKGNDPYIFRLNGQNYHSIGSLLLEQKFKPKFSQFYI
uniref:Uncharacterized protein n=1 Tax=Lactuca sativa TaxID=4236 RepID=A0A9R1W1H4_LACSA|nr:hypothetical protein LSAT_V11C300140550 [Lactuca sativa]